MILLAKGSEPQATPFIWKGINLGWSHTSTTLKLSFREYDGLKKKKRKERKKKNPFSSIQ